MENNWKGKRVLITGICGTVGKELLRQILSKDPEMIVGLDNNESELFFLAEEYKEEKNVLFNLCDIKDTSQIKSHFKDIDIVLHTAARKHVILNEKAPLEAIQTNILGSQNIIGAAVECNVKRVIFTSSDKAVNPTNVMGTSKLMGERLITAANAHKRNGGTIFASTRFGNVLGSNGSVIPLFKKQIAKGGPVTLTDENMSRFIMTLEEAVHLVMESVFLARGGEVFVTKMPTIRIKELAEAMIEILAPDSSVDISVIGSKAGEKLYEELMNEEETRRTLELEKYFVVTPAFKAIYEDIVYDYPDKRADSVDRVYRSDQENFMTKDELKEYLINKNLI